MATQHTVRIRSANIPRALLTPYRKIEIEGSLCRTLYLKDEGDCLHMAKSKPNFLIKEIKPDAK